jgi:hypothetical protein
MRTFGAIEKNMYRLLHLLIILVGTIQVYGQDSTFVNETCKLIKEAGNHDTNRQFKIIENQAIKYVNSSSIAGSANSKELQETYRFYYKLSRELVRNCASYTLGIFPVRANRVVDLEGKFTKEQIDSLKNLSFRLGNEKNVYLFIVTIDDYYPDKSIEEFAKKKRDYWGMGHNAENGGVLVALSFSKKEVMISTSEVAMKYLTDGECSDVIDIMTPEFRNGKYFEGVVNGLNGIMERL